MVSTYCQSSLSLPCKLPYSGDSCIRDGLTHNVCNLLDLGLRKRALRVVVFDGSAYGTIIGRRPVVLVSSIEGCRLLYLHIELAGTWLANQLIGGVSYGNLQYFDHNTWILAFARW